MPKNRSGLLIALVLLGVFVGALCWTAGASAGRNPRAGSPSVNCVTPTATKGEPDLGGGGKQPVPSPLGDQGVGPRELTTMQRLALISRLLRAKYLGT
jgi:hypothetical protein